MSRVFDIARPFQSFLTSGFTIENRPTDPQTSESMASYLRARRSKGESFLVALSDLHFLLFLSNLLDMATDMPILCSKVRVRVRVRVRIRFSDQPLTLSSQPTSTLSLSRALPLSSKVVARDASDLDGFQMMARPRTSNRGLGLGGGAGGGLGWTCRDGASHLSRDPTLSSLPGQLLRGHGVARLPARGLRLGVITT